MDASVTIGARDARARDKLSQYIARGPIALGNVIYDAVKGRVIVKTRFNPWLKENLHLLDAEEFLARLTQFIPPARVRWIRYYGLYSLRSRGKWHLWPSVVAAAPEGWKRKHGAALPVPEPPVHRPPNPTWARLIARIYETDPLVCPRCSSPMKVVAVVLDSREVLRILRHLVRIGRAPPGLDTADPAFSAN